MAVLRPLLRLLYSTVREQGIGDQLRLILPISGGHSSNLLMRVLCPSILLYPSGRVDCGLVDIRLLYEYLQVGAVRLLYQSAEDIRILYSIPTGGGRLSNIPAVQ